MITDPSETSIAELQNPTLNREVKKKPQQVTEAENPINEVDLNTYSQETLTDKSKLERNPNCIIHLENDTGNTLVRNERIIQDANGNEKRVYTYNVVTKDKKFAADISGFKPMEVDADETDLQIKNFLRKGITSAEKIENIEDAKLAMLSGVISRKDYLQVEERLNSKSKTEITEQSQKPIQTPPETAQTINTIRIETQEDSSADRVIKELNQKYFTQDVDNYFKNFLQNTLSEMDSSLNKFGYFLEEVGNLNANTILENVKDCMNYYQESIIPKLNETNDFLSKFNLLEVNIDIKKIDTEINQLQSRISPSTDEAIRDKVKQEISKLEEFRQRMIEFRNKAQMISEEIKQLIQGKGSQMFDKLSEQAIGLGPITQIKEDFQNKLFSISRNIY